MTELGTFRDDFYHGMAVLPPAAYRASTQATGTVLAAASFVNANFNYLALSTRAAVTLTTDTASNIITQLQRALFVQAAALGGAVPAGLPGSQTYTKPVAFFLRIINNNSGTLTLTGGTGVTITSGGTVANGVSQDYVVSITGLNTITLQGVGTATP